jgi:two-component system response regulator LytT
MIRVVIVEDEAYAVKRLRSILSEIGGGIEVVAVHGNIEDAVKWFRDSPAPDLVFMDVHLSDGDCFEIFREIEPAFPVIFVTAYDQYAIRAFRVNGIDYLLKPVRKEEVGRSLEKFRELRTIHPPGGDYRLLKEELGNLSRTYQRRILIRVGRKITRVEIGEIAYFYAEGKGNTLCTFSGRQLPIDQSLEEIMKILDPAVFFRINRKLIVNADAIEALYAYSRSRIKLSLKPPFHLDVIVSTDKTPGFRQWLTGETGPA